MAIINFDLKNQPQSDIGNLLKLQETYFLIVKIFNFLSIQVRFLNEGDKNQKIAQMSNQA